MWARVLARVGYGSAAGVAGILLALLVVILSGPHFRNAETWEGLALGWLYFGVPATAVGIAVSSVLVFPIYRSCRSWVSAGAVFLLNLLMIALVVLILAAWAAGILVFAS